MPKCSFCGEGLSEGKGKMLVRNDYRVLYFCDSKCHKNFAMGRNAKKVGWVRKKLHNKIQATKAQKEIAVPVKEKAIAEKPTKPKAAEPKPAGLAK